MSEIARKKDTGEPGNGGQFGSAPKAGSGLTLAPIDTTRVRLEDLDRMASHGEVARRTAVALRGVQLGHALTAAGITSLKVTNYTDGGLYVSEAVDEHGEVRQDDLLLGHAEGALTRSRLTFEDLRLLSRHPSGTQDTIELDPTSFDTEEQIKAGFAARDLVWRATYDNDQDLPKAS